MNKKVDKLKLSKKYDRIRLPALNFAFELFYMQGLSVQNTKSLKRTGQELLLWHVLTGGITGRTTFWSISHKDFFLPELSTILVWLSLDLQRPWHLSSQEIKKRFSKSRMFMKYDSPSITAWTVVVGFFSHQVHELPTRLLLSGLWPSQKSALVNFLLQYFSPSRVNTLWT